MNNATDGTAGHNRAVDRTMPESTARAVPTEPDELKDDVRLPPRASWSVPSAQAARVPSLRSTNSAKRHHGPADDTASDLASKARSAAATQGAEAMVENAWDFTKPDSIPGFASMPQPAETPTTDARGLARADR